MKFTVLLATAALVLGACSGYKKGEVVQNSGREIRIAMGYNAANEGVDTFRQAAEHCADEVEDLVAIWYGHDKEGNLVYRCE